MGYINFYHNTREYRMSNTTIQIHMLFICYTFKTISNKLQTQYLPNWIESDVELLVYFWHLKAIQKSHTETIMYEKKSIFKSFCCIFFFNLKTFTSLKMSICYLHFNHNVKSVIYTSLLNFVCHK